MDVGFKVGNLNSQSIHGSYKGHLQQRQEGGKNGHTKGSNLPLLNRLNLSRELLLFWVSLPLHLLSLYKLPFLSFLRLKASDISVQA